MCSGSSGTFAQDQLAEGHEEQHGLFQDGSVLTASATEAQPHSLSGGGQWTGGKVFLRGAICAEAVTSSGHSVASRILY